MKKYYVSYPRDFANEYSLVWADDEHPIPDDCGWKHITRKEAVRLAAAEADRRKTDGSFSGYADEYIFPWFIDGTYEEIYYPERGHAFRVHTNNRRNEYDGIIMYESNNRIVDF